MTTIMPEGESLRRAVKWISEKRQAAENQADIQKLVQDACLRFNLTPKEGEFLTRFIREESA